MYDTPFSLLFFKYWCQLPSHDIFPPNTNFAALRNKWRLKSTLLDETKRFCPIQKAETLTQKLMYWVGQPKHSPEEEKSPLIAQIQNKLEWNIYIHIYSVIYQMCGFLKWRIWLYIYVCMYNILIYIWHVKIYKMYMFIYINYMYYIHIFF